LVASRITNRPSNAELGRELGWEFTLGDDVRRVCAGEHLAVGGKTLDHRLGDQPMLATAGDDEIPTHLGTPTHQRILAGVTGNAARAQVQLTAHGFRRLAHTSQPGSWPCSFSGGHR